MRSNGDDSSTSLCTSGSPLNVAVRLPMGPRAGFAAHTMSHGRTPLIRKTAINIPHRRNHLLAFFDIVDKTSALIMALSMLIMTSKSARPAMVNRRRIISAIEEYWLP